MVEGGGLENRCAARYRGFESCSLRHFLLMWFFSAEHIFMDCILFLANCSRHEGHEEYEED